MDIVRALAVVLVTLVGAGNALLDSCVLGCHSHAHEQTREADQHRAHCHDSVAPTDQARWQATSTCNHDHSELSADLGSQPRPDFGPRLVALAVSPQPAAPSNRAAAASRPVGGEETDLPFRSPTFLSPLRL